MTPIYVLVASLLVGMGLISCRYFVRRGGTSGDRASASTRRANESRGASEGVCEVSIDSVCNFLEMTRSNEEGSTASRSSGRESLAYRRSDRPTTEHESILYFEGPLDKETVIEIVPPCVQVDRRYQ
jgi:hypothetical protein